MYFTAILIFLIVREKDWQKIWDFAIIVGIIVSIIAIFQQFGKFSKFLIPSGGRPISTMGNAILLALFLLLLTFAALSFGITARNWAKRIFYFFSVLLFISVSIILVQTRGAFLGIATGFLWFLFAYPKKKLNKMKIEKFEDIISWQNDRELNQQIYKTFKSNPDYSFCDQIKRASISSCNNIPEGYERKTNNEFKHFLFIAKGSAGEVRSMIYNALDLKYISDGAFKIMQNKLDEISKLISGLIKTL